MPISHGHKQFDYGEFVPEMGAQDLIHAVELKQNLYDQGVAQIQAQIDAVSTLPLVKDADKRYLNQELDKYYQVIKSNVGSADFSNPNAVKSFLDIARPMENDPIIRNAIESTNEYMNRRKTMEDIRTNKPHLYSPANEWDYMNDVGKWLEDDTPGVRLNKKYYNPSVDVAKKVADLTAKLKPEIESDMAKAGGFISEEQKTFLSAERIKNAIMASMSPQELQQMDIDARYHASNLSQEQKYNEVVRHYAGLHDTYTTLGRIKGIENTGTTSQDYLRDAAALKEVTNALRDPKTGYVNEAYLDRLYANMFTQNWAAGQGEAYKYKQSVKKWETNPYDLAAYNATKTVESYKAKYDYKLEQDYMQMQRTGEIIQDPKTGQWVPNPKAASKTGKAPKTAPLGMMAQNLSDENVKRFLEDPKKGSYNLNTSQFNNQTTAEFRNWLFGEVGDRLDILNDDGTYKIDNLKISKQGNDLMYEIKVGDKSLSIRRAANGIFTPTSTAIPGSETQSEPGSGVRPAEPAIESDQDVNP